MRSPKLTAQPTIAFFATVNHALSSSRKLEGAAEHLFPEFSKLYICAVRTRFLALATDMFTPFYQLQEATRETAACL